MQGQRGPLAQDIRAALLQLDSVKPGCVQPLYASLVKWEQYQHTPPRALKDHQKGQGMESGTECTQEMPYLVRSPAPVTGGTVVITGCSARTENGWVRAVGL